MGTRMGIGMARGLKCGMIGADLYRLQYKKKLRYF